MDRPLVIPACNVDVVIVLLIQCKGLSCDIHNHNLRVVGIDYNILLRRRLLNSSHLERVK